jgi:copper chaperone
METMTVTAPAISCEHCQRTVEGAVGALPGVREVHVEIPTKAVRVSYDPARISRQQIEATLDDEGYPVTA